MTSPQNESLDAVLNGSWIRGRHHAAELSSTNDFALQRIADEPPERVPLLVLADRQTAGRGRGANVWWAGEGALTFSLILEPRQWKLDRSLWPRLSVAVGGAVAEVLDAWLPGKAVRVKWPNDVYINGRKICGVLVETSPHSSERLVIGIGINVENSFVGAPEDVQRRAVSLIDVSQNPPTRLAVLKAVLRQLDADLHLLAERPHELLTRWRSKCFLTGKSVSISSVDREIFGMCLGIEDDASLLVHSELGPQRCYAGVVTVLESGNTPVNG